MTRFIITAALAAALASPAAAQVAGTYSGTSADGNAVSFTVTQPGGAGTAYVITGASVSFSDLCPGGSTLNAATGYDPNATIGRTGVVHSNFGYAYATIDFSLTFASSGQSANGTIVTASPTLSPVGPHPTAALLCRAKPQTMGVTLQPPGFEPPPAEGAASSFHVTAR